MTSSSPPSLPTLGTPLLSSLVDTVIRRAAGASADGLGLFSRLGPALVIVNSSADDGSSNGSGSSSSTSSGTSSLLDINSSQRQFPSTSSTLVAATIAASIAAGPPPPPRADAVYGDAVLWRYHAEAARDKEASKSRAARAAARGTPPRHALPPHLFSFAATALRDASETGTPQVLIFMGERGAGKRTAGRAALAYITAVARAESRALAARVDLLRNVALDAALRAARGAPVGRLSFEHLSAAAAHAAAAVTAATGDVGGGGGSGSNSFAHRGTKSSSSSLLSLHPLLNAPLPSLLVSGRGAYSFGRTTGAAVTEEDGSKSASPSAVRAALRRNADIEQTLSALLPAGDAVSRATSRNTSTSLLHSSATAAPLEVLILDAMTVLEAFAAVGDYGAKSASSSRVALRVRVKVARGTGTLEGAEVDACLYDAARVAVPPPSVAFNNAAKATAALAHESRVNFTQQAPVRSAAAAAYLAESIAAAPKPLAPTPPPPFAVDTNFRIFYLLLCPDALFPANEFVAVTRLPSHNPSEYELLAAYGLSATHVDWVRSMPLIRKNNVAAAASNHLQGHSSAASAYLGGGGEEELFISSSPPASAASLSSSLLRQEGAILTAALERLGLPRGAAQNALWRILSACLLSGNLTWIAAPAPDTYRATGAPAVLAGGSPLAPLAALLGVAPTELVAALSGEASIRGPHGGGAEFRAKVASDGLSVTLFARLFVALTGHVNASLNGAAAVGTAGRAELAALLARARAALGSRSPLVFSLFGEKSENSQQSGIQSGGGGGTTIDIVLAPGGARSALCAPGSICGLGDLLSSYACDKLETEYRSSLITAPAAAYAREGLLTAHPYLAALASGGGAPGGLLGESENGMLSSGHWRGARELASLPALPSSAAAVALVSALDGVEGVAPRGVLPLLADAARYAFSRGAVANPQGITAGLAASSVAGDGGSLASHTGPIWTRSHWAAAAGASGHRDADWVVTVASRVAVTSSSNNSQGGGSSVATLRRALASDIASSLVAAAHELQTPPSSSPVSLLTSQSNTSASTNLTSTTSAAATASARLATNFTSGLAFSSRTSSGGAASTPTPPVSAYAFPVPAGFTVASFGTPLIATGPGTLTPSSYAPAYAPSPRTTCTATTTATTATTLGLPPSARLPSAPTFWVSHMSGTALYSAESWLASDAAGGGAGSLLTDNSSSSSSSSSVREIVGGTGVCDFSRAAPGLAPTDVLALVAKASFEPLAALLAGRVLPPSLVAASAAASDAAFTLGLHAAGAAAAAAAGAAGAAVAAMRDTSRGGGVSAAKKSARSASTSTSATSVTPIHSSIIPITLTVALGALSGNQQNKRLDIPSSVFSSSSGVRGGGGGEGGVYIIILV